MSSAASTSQSKDIEDQGTVRQRMEASVLNSKASTSYRTIQDIESRRLLFDILTNKENTSGLNPHEDFECTTTSTIYALVYGF